MQLLVINDIVWVLAYGALVFSFFEIYLMLNKLWKRKHLKDVAESISVSSRMIGLIPLSIFTLNYALEGQWQGVIEGLMWLFAGCLQLLIGIGFWVRANKRVSFSKLLKKALKLEKKEFGTLARKLLSPHAYNDFIDVLSNLAFIDGRFDDRRKQFISDLAKEWNVTLIWGGIKAKQKKMGNTPFINFWDELSLFVRNHSDKDIEILSEAIHNLMEQGNYPSAIKKMINEELEEIVYDPKSSLDGKLGIVPQNVEQAYYLQNKYLALEFSNDFGGEAYLLSNIRTDAFQASIRNEFQQKGYFIAELK